MTTNKPWIAIATVSLAVAALTASPLGHAAAEAILPNASVGTPQLKAGAVTAAKVKNGSLTAAKFKAGQLPAGPKGDPGPAGPKGDKGDTGAPGLSGYIHAVGGHVAIAPGQSNNSTALCPAGKKAIGGGALGSDGFAIQYSVPMGDGSGWSVVARNYGNSIGHLTAVAVCATLS